MQNEEIDWMVCSILPCLSMVLLHLIQLILTYACLVSGFDEMQPCVMLILCTTMLHL